MMNRGGFGLGKSHQQIKAKEEYKKAGEQLEKGKMSALTQQLETFAKNLEIFANKYKDEIKYNPDFREKFYLMCMELKVDPLASISLWSKNLNLTEFYYNLAIQIITISMHRGPLIELNELRVILMDKMKMTDITLLDIEKAVESVSELKCGFQVIDIKNSKAVVTVPMEKSSDMDLVINIASENGGWIGYTTFFEKSSISKLKFDAAIESLTRHGVAWADDQLFVTSQTKVDDTIYWFPGLIRH